MKFRFNLCCPKCGRRSFAVLDDPKPPVMNCGDCLVDRTEVVEMRLGSTTRQHSRRKIYRAIDSRGKIHKRTTADRTYAFAVVTHYAARPAPAHLPALGPSAAHSEAEWCSRRDLAENIARRSRRQQESGNYVEGVEILEAELVRGVS